MSDKMLGFAPAKVVPYSTPPDRNAWKQTNKTYRNMVDFGKHIDLVLSHRGSKRFLMCFGPPGIAKTTTVNQKFAEEYVRLEKIWRDTDPELRESVLPNSTEYLGIGIAKFAEPFKKVSGRIKARRLFMVMSDYSDEHKMVNLDDITFDPEIQALLHGATDKSNDYRMTWDTSKDIEYKGVSYENECSFYGSLIMTANTKKGSIEMSKKFSDALRDRAYEIHFDWDRVDIGQYVLMLAFQEGGLHRYINRKNSRGSNGLGLTMSVADSNPLLREVRNYFAANLSQVKNIGFRLLEDLVSKRIFFGPPNGTIEDFERQALHTIKTQT